MVQIFGSVRSRDQGVLLHKATGRVDSPNNYETCLFNGQIDDWMPLNNYLTSSADLSAKLKTVCIIPDFATSRILNDQMKLIHN
jgi:hypothetical protein